MTGGRKILAVAAVLICTIAGCVNSGRRVAMRRTPHKYMLYNPRRTGLPTVDVARSDWPSTVKYYSTGEVLDYQVSTYDLQGTVGQSQDYYYRRFDGVRSGRGYR